MIRTTAIFSAHAIHVLHIVVRDLFIVLIILLAACFFWLIHGISIEKLELGSYKIDGLYIKLDKKLTLKAKALTVPQQKASPSFGRVDRTFDQIKHLLTFFDTIMLEKINFKNNHLTLLYADDVLYITSDVYEIAGNIRRKGQKLVADVSLLYIKKENITLSGKLSYDLSSNVLDTEGIFEGYGISGHFRAEKRGNTIIYALNTDPFSDIRPVMERVHLPKAIDVWVTEKVRAKRYKVAYLTGKLALEGEKIRLDIDSLRGKIGFEDVTIAYKKGVTPAHAKSMDLVYEKGSLYFSLIEPRHRERSLDGTTVVISHVDGKGDPVLTLDLHALTPVDDELQKILKAYHLNIPVFHTAKTDKLNVVLKIPLGRKSKKKKIDVQVDALLSPGILKVDTLSLAVESGHVRYENGKVKIEKVRVNDRWYKGTIEGMIDIQKKDVTLMLDTDVFVLGKRKAPFLMLKKKKIRVSLSYGKILHITIPMLGVKIERRKDQWHILLSDLSRLVPYITDNRFGIRGGTLNIETNDMQHIAFSGRIEKDICFFYEKNEKCYTSIPVEGKVDTQNGQFDLYAFHRKLKANLSKGRVMLKDLNIDLKVLLQEQKKLKRSGSVIGKKFVIIGEKSQLRYSPYKLVLDSYDIEISPKGNIKAIGSLDGDIVKFTKKGRYFVLQALRIKDKMLHPLINFTGLKQGRYSLKKEGDPDKEMKGRIIIEGGVLSDFKAYSNTLAFINTLPALATLHKPGFSNKGFKIEEGVVEYRMTPKKIVFDSVYLKGNSATVVGKGTVDLVTRKIDIKLAIMTVRELGKIVGKIPLLGYILMGDDNSMTVGLRVGGTLDDPKISTSVGEDILTLPLQILKRTITAPAHLVPPKKKGEKKSKNQPPEELKKENYIDAL